MKSRHHFLKSFVSDWKLVLLLALPIFAVAMWYGIAQDYQDLGLFAAAMALAAWGIAGRAVVVVRKWREWRSKSRASRD